MLISQRERRIDVYRRDGRRWILDERGPAERMTLDAVGVEIAVDEVYVDGMGSIVS